MDFNKANVFSSINADEVEIGTMGYYGDDFDSLRKCVNTNDRRFCGIVSKIRSDTQARRFIMDGFDESFALFYPIE